MSCLSQLNDIKVIEWKRGDCECVVMEERQERELVSFLGQGVAYGEWETSEAESSVIKVIIEKRFRTVATGSALDPV